MNIRKLVEQILPPLAADLIRPWVRKDYDEAALRVYERERKPYSRGYRIYVQRLVVRTLNDGGPVESFRRGAPLPDGFGRDIDERCVEYPWVLANLPAGPARMLDAGSTLNYDFLLDQEVVREKLLHILTFAPEERCFWNRGISYLFADLREIPVRDAYYDVIVCISTLEHVGCDNSRWTNQDSHREDRPDDFPLAMSELRRVLRPGGLLLLTVPFGAYCHYGWFQQFTRSLLSRAIDAFGSAAECIETFYRYTPGGWRRATAEECADCEYVRSYKGPPSQWTRPIPLEPDGAVAARAVACVRIVKQ